MPPEVWRQRRERYLMSIEQYVQLKTKLHATRQMRLVIIDGRIDRVEYGPTVCDELLQRCEESMRRIAVEFGLEIPA
jgi:hypothetical protein